MKQILVLTGPGFSDQEDIASLPGLHGERVLLRSVQALESIEEFSTADVVLMRGPWTANPEERLFAKALADKLDPGLQVFAKRQERAKENPPLLIAIGRGALVALASKALGLCDFDALEWVPAFKNQGPWIEVQMSHSNKESFMALVQGRALPAAGPGTFRDSVIPWLSDIQGAGAPPVGLRLGKSTLLSFVDILGFGDRTQMPDYGYRELASIPTQEKVLNTLIEGNF